jgi:hypothetical protein
VFPHLVIIIFFPVSNWNAPLQVRLPPKTKLNTFRCNSAPVLPAISTHFHRQGEFSTGFQPKIADQDDSRIAELCSQG